MQQDYDNSTDEGRVGTKEMIEFFYKFDNVAEIFDKQDNLWEQFHTGTDIVIKTDNGIQSSCDVKTDKTFYNSFNIFVELVGVIKDNKEQTPGWFIKNTCQYIIYYFRTRGIVFRLPLTELRNALLEPKGTNTVLDSYPEGKGSSVRNGVEWTSYGKLIPVKDLVFLVPTHRRWDINYNK